ncbi:PadR family transcriptional regulator [Nonomuraea soli]
MYPVSNELSLAILGFLFERQMHGYELKSRLVALSGHRRPISDGALYPAIARLREKGLVVAHEERGSAAAARHMLTLTLPGREELMDRLRSPKDVEITDQTRFFTLLTFLSVLPDRADQVKVLRRRLDFLETPASFFYDSGKPVRAEEEPDPFRRGMLLVARATGTAEKEWLRATIEELSLPQ